MNTNERVAVMLGAAEQARSGDLVMALPAAGSHAIGCACCGGRDPLAVALAGAYVARVRGTGPWFDRVLLLGDAGEALRVEAVLAADPMMQARFRPASPLFTVSQDGGRHDGSGRGRV